MAPPRTFSWEEARRLRDEGWSYAAIASELGAGLHGVRGACRPEDVREHRQAQTAGYVRARRRLGLHYDYDFCSCGNLKDQRGVQCQACRTARQAHDRERRQAHLDLVREERRALRLKQLAYLREGFSPLQVAEFTGGSRSHMQRLRAEDEEQRCASSGLA